jgi:hypothetical protein
VAKVVVKKRPPSPAPSTDGAAQVRQRNLQDVQTEMARLISSVDAIKRHGTTGQLAWTALFLRHMYQSLDTITEEAPWR